MKLTTLAACMLLAGCGEQLIKTPSKTNDDYVYPGGWDDTNAPKIVFDEDKNAEIDDAVKRGHAYWHLNEDGTTEFKWKEETK